MGDGVANGSVLDFGALTGVHFAPLLAVGRRRTGRAPGEPVLMSDLDVSRAQHLGELADAGEGIDRALRALRGLPGGGRRPARLPAPPRRQGGGQLREHARPHRAPDQAGGAAARRDPGLPRHAATGAASSPATSAGRARARRGRPRARLGARAGRATRAVSRACARSCTWSSIPLLLLPFAAAALLAAPLFLVVLRHARAPRRRPRTSGRRRSASSSSRRSRTTSSRTRSWPSGSVKPGRFRRLTLTR